MLSRIFSVSSHRAEVVSADALQVYRHLDIGTAKPGADLLSRIPHHLIDIIDYPESFSVGDFCKRTDEALAGILRREHLPVISGGTAYYLKSWLLGMPETPLSDPRIRSELETHWAGKTSEALKEEILRIDPVSARRIGRGDRYRMLRVLEVYLQTGRPLSSFSVPDSPREDYNVLSIGLTRERQELYSRINQRVEEMFSDGLAAEVAALRRRGASASDPGMKGIGYREWFGEPGDSREPGEPDPDENRVKELIARNSRRYAKRQITFFSSLPDVHWFDAGEDPDGPGGILMLINAFLHENPSLYSIDQEASHGDNP
jgi:tRNA dimethylallyltransferase